MCTNNSQANNNGEEEFIEKLASWIVQGINKVLRMGIMHSYAPIHWHQWDKRKTHKRGVKYLAFTNRGDPSKPGPRRHWRVHPARECPMALVRDGVASRHLRLPSHPPRLRLAAPRPIPPRLIACLSEASLEGLATIYQAAEATGDFPKAARNVEVRLIGPKRRPIGLYPAVYRVWSRLHVDKVRAWDDR